MCMSDVMNIPESWREIVEEETRQPYFAELARFVVLERQKHQVFPSPEDLYSALRHTRFEQVNVLLLGQDPYHDIGQAHGMCFSVRAGIHPPPSLVNIFKELKADLAIDIPPSGCLTKWADQGVLLLNSVLTVRAHEPQSHKGRGWERFTDAIIQKISYQRDAVVFVLWGAVAQKKESLIDASRHTIIKSAHPSPLSARNGFFGSRPFSRINAALRATAKAEIDWHL
jgi:uracil-DNA glycosylase